MGSGFSKQKKQAKKMQEQFLQMQEELKSLEVEGSAANGLVKVKLNGDGDIIQLKIDPRCVDPEDIEGLEDLVCAAFKDAKEKLQKASPLNQMQSMPSLGGLGGLNPFGL
jgi:DNA-binding YbaB/EbfC family protein